MSAPRNRKRWIEQASPPPTDLRLLPAATAIWTGSALGLLDPKAAGWSVGFAVLALIGVILARTAWWPGWAVVAVSLAVAVVITALRAGQSANDPLTEAASRGSWATLSVMVTGFPRSVDSGFVVPDNGSGSETAHSDEARWQVAVVAARAVVAGQWWDSQAPVVVYGEGAEWASVVPGQELAVSGRLGEQAFGSGTQIVVHGRDPPLLTADAHWWNTAAGEIRRTLAGNASHLDSDAAGLLPGLVVGDTGGISDRLDDDAKTAGISHLLAVSGSHFAILCGMVVVLLRRAGPRCAALGGAVTLVGLVVLVGPQPSVLRAALMGAISLLALLTGRTRSAVPALAAAVIVLLLVDPRLALTAGFALSVLATGGLILIAPAWSGALQRRGVPRGWADVLAVPVAAQVVTMPVIVMLSGSVSMVGVLANLLVAPVVAPALILGVLCALTGPWWPSAATVLAEMTGPLLRWVAAVAHTLARWPSATVPWPATPNGAIFLTLLTIAAVMLLRHRRFRGLLGAAVVGAGLVLVPARVVASGWPATGWILTACEVGQGDAMVLSTGDEGSAVVIDTGPDPDLVDGCLSRLGVATIPLLILTHLHADHVDGLAGAMHGRSVGAIAIGPGREPAAAWRNILAGAGGRGIPVVELHPGIRWSSGELTLTDLGPEKAFNGTDSDPNNDSVVVMAERGGRRILMSGDIELEAQQALLNAGIDLHADILKVPHHGSSKLLDRFVEAVSPTVAVIGVGTDNDYGHPSPRALELLRREGVRTFRTDEQGDVAVGVADDMLTAATRGASITGQRR